MKKTLHTFDPEEAEEHGLTGSVVLRHLQFWISFNKSKGKNFVEGRTWTYQTIKFMHEQMPYLSIKALRNALKRLKQKGVLLEGNFNKRSNDHTKWYSLEHQEPLTFPSTQKGNRGAQKGKALPDTKKNINPSNHIRPPGPTSVAVLESKSFTCQNTTSEDASPDGLEERGLDGFI